MINTNWEIKKQNKTPVINWKGTEKVTQNGEQKEVENVKKW